MAFTLNHYTSMSDSVSSLNDIKEQLLSAARAAKEAGRTDEVTVEIGGGWYYLDTPIRLSAKENPELDSLKITLCGKGAEKPFIHCFRRFEGKTFEAVEGKPYFRHPVVAEDGSTPLFHNLFVNALSVEMSKSPVWRNPDLLTSEDRAGKSGRRGFYVPYEIAATLAKGPIGAAELVMYVEWEFVALHIAGVDLADTREFDGVRHALVLIREEEIYDFIRNCHPELNIKNRETFVRNSPVFLTEPGTYAYDYTAGELLVVPPKGYGMAQCFVQYPTAENYLILEGLRDFTVRGIEFTGLTCKHLCTTYYHSGQANALYQGEVRGDHERQRLRVAAILTSDMQGFTVDRCVFRDLGGNGLQMVNRTNGATVRDCLFENVGMSAVSIGNPIADWDNEQNRNFSLRIQNNFFRHIGYEYPTALCMFVGTVDGLKILHNTIEGCAYSAMSVGWGWDRVYYAEGEKCNVHNAEIAYNHIHNYMDVLRDGGAIYVVGGNCDIDCTSERFNVMHDNYAMLDDFRDKSKFGYYCDGSSTNWEVRDSVIVNCDRPLFSQCTVARAYTYHNHFFNIYATRPYETCSVAPERDTCFYDYYLVEEGEDALFEKHPKAKAIKEAAGCSIPF